jgi:hypothetical protein
MAFFDEASPRIDKINDISLLETPIGFRDDDPLTEYDFMFGQLLTDPGNLLPATNPTETIKVLTALGNSMRLDSGVFKLSSIPSAYTYFGQFVDHDVSLAAISKSTPELADPCSITRFGTDPLKPAEVTANFKNKRNSFLQLDTIYKGGPPRNGDLLILGQLSKSDHPIRTADADNDVPRKTNNEKTPIIGDQRNDQTLIISQLHVGFMRAHNEIVKTGKSYSEARELLIQHYHWLIIHDFLQRFVRPEILQQVLAGEKLRYQLRNKPFYIPLEFTAAAYRFGHAQSLHSYYYNDNFPGQGLGSLFTFPALGKYPSLPEMSVIQWEHFLGIGEFLNWARDPNPSVVEPLSNVLGPTGIPLPCERSLAKMDLLRGYSWGLPTGQAVARALGYKELSAADIESVSISKEMTSILQSGLSSRTPLWFYILAEAAWAQAHDHPYRYPDPRSELRGFLGRVGSRIIAEVLIGLIRESPDSILDDAQWTPELGLNGNFTLVDLFRLARVLDL